MMSEKVTFQELVDSIASQTDNTKQFTHDFLKDFVTVINEGLDSDGTVNIAGFGKFKLRAMDEREGVNPQTGEKITIPAHNKVVFKPYKDLRELVNAPYGHLEPELLDDDENDTSESGQVQETKSPQGSDDDELNATSREEKTFKKIGSKETAEPPIQKEDPLGPDDEHKPEEKSAQSTEIDPEDDAEHDIVEYSPHLQAETGDQSSKDMLLDLPMLQKSKISEPESLEITTLDETSSDYDEIKTKNNEQDISSYEDPFGIEQASDVEVDADEPADLPEAQESETGSVQTSPEHEELDAEVSESFEPNVHEPSNKQNGRKGFRMVTAAAILLLIGAGIWYLFTPRSVILDNVSGMITGIADRHWNQPAAPVQPKVPVQEEQEPAPPADQDKEHQRSRASHTQVTIPEGQTLWSLADQEYDDPYLWPWIYDRNKTDISNPDKVLAGQSLRVPVPSGKEGLLAGRDSLEVALGYVETYRWYKANNYNKAKYYLYAAKSYRRNVFDHTNVNIDKADLAFANRVR